MQRPLSTEFKPYFQRYVDLVAEGSFADVLGRNTARAIDFFSQLHPEKHNFQYAPGKWTVKDVLMHIIDTERVMSYRALVAARGDSTTPLHTMDVDSYASNVDVSARSMESLLKEFASVRAASEYLFTNLTEEQSIRKGNAIDYTVTPRALAYIIVGHVEHHMKVISERYL
jgi:uncharacterized damage-inducible protein DinB